MIMSSFLPVEVFVFVAVLTDESQSLQAVKVPQLELSFPGEKALRSKKARCHPTQRNTPGSLKSL